jgi:hypothetical protein
VTYKSLFDEYGRKAQVSPALLVVLPLLLTSLAMLPGAAPPKETVITLAFGLGVLYWMANIARQAGKRAETTLFPGGLPGKEWLRHQDSTLETPTKRRYKRFLSERIPDIAFLSPEDEIADPERADEAYASAVRWLVENTRDNARVRQELIAYGFRRNLYGLRWWGIGVPLVTAVAAAAILWWRHGPSTLTEAPEALVAAAISGCILPALWLSTVTPAWVRSAATCYAKALFGFCDLVANPNGARTEDPEAKPAAN